MSNKLNKSVVKLSDKEDLYLSKLAEQLDREDVKTYSHDEVWQ